MLLTLIALLPVCSVSFAEGETQGWQEGYLNILNITKIADSTRFVLVDTDYDEVPELFCGDDNFVTAFSFKEGAVKKLYETYSVPIEYIANMKAFYNSSSQITEFLGQAFLGDSKKPTSYKIDFLPDAILCTAYGDVRATNYFKNASIVPHAISVLGNDELKGEDHAISFKNFADRYSFLTNLSDDTATISLSDRSKIKKQVADGTFLCFEKISKISKNALFVQYYTTNDDESILIPYEKHYALILDDKSTKIYKGESKIDLDGILKIKDNNFDASNVYIDYSKARSFLSFDEHIKYFENLVSENKATANANGKAALYNYIEYAVNKSARTQLKSKNNVYTIDKNAASLISQYAKDCEGSMNAILKSAKLTPESRLRIVPAVVCAGIDLDSPVRIEFKAGVSKSLAEVTGIKVMLDSTHGIYLSTEEIRAHENTADSFCVEIKHSPGKISVCFADRNNVVLDKLNTGVSFILPASSKFSSVYAINNGKSKAINGSFNLLNKTVTFKTKTPGTFQVVNIDVTINDAKNMSDDTLSAVSFLTAFNAISLDKNNSFNQSGDFSNYEFAKSVIKLFYAVNPNATASFSDVLKESEYYPYVATAEELGLTFCEADGKFNGNQSVTREAAAVACGRILVKSGLYSYSADKNLPYLDKNTISDIAVPDIKVLLDAGVIDAQKHFSKNKALSKKECAELLYRTYMALCKPQKITTVSAIKVRSAPITENNAPDWEFRTAIIIIAAMVLLFIGYIIRKLVKRRKK